MPAAERLLGRIHTALAAWVHMWGKKRERPQAAHRPLRRGCAQCEGRLVGIGTWRPCPLHVTELPSALWQVKANQYDVEGRGRFEGLQCASEGLRNARSPE